MDDLHLSRKRELDTYRTEILTMNNCVFKIFHLLVLYFVPTVRVTLDLLRCLASIPPCFLHKDDLTQEINACCSGHQSTRPAPPARDLDMVGALYEPLPAT